MASNPFSDITANRGAPRASSNPFGDITASGGMAPASTPQVANPFGDITASRSTAPAPEQPGILSKAANAFGTVAGAMKRGVDTAANYYTEQALGVPETVLSEGAMPNVPTTGTLVRTGLGLNPENAPGYGGRLAGKAVEFATDLGTDPLTYLAAGLGKAAPVAGRVASGVFAGQMGLGALEEGKQTYETLRREGLTPQAAEQALGTVLSAGGALMAGHHAAAGEGAHAAPVRPEAVPPAPDFAQEFPPGAQPDAGSPGVVTPTEATAAAVARQRADLEAAARAPRVWKGEPPPEFAQEPTAIRTPEEVRADMTGAPDVWQGEPQQRAGVPFTITRDAHQQLADLGYSAADRNAMRPEEAQDILGAQRSKPASAGNVKFSAQPEDQHRLPAIPEAERKARPVAPSALDALPPEAKPLAKEWGLEAAKAYADEGRSVDKARFDASLPEALRGHADRLRGYVTDAAAAIIEGRDHRETFREKYGDEGADGLTLEPAGPPGSYDLVQRQGNKVVGGAVVANHELKYIFGGKALDAGRSASEIYKELDDRGVRRNDITTVLGTGAREKAQNVADAQGRGGQAPEAGGAARYGPADQGAHPGDRGAAREGPRGDLRQEAGASPEVAYSPNPPGSPESSMRALRGRVSESLQRFSGAGLSFKDQGSHFAATTPSGVRIEVHPGEIRIDRSALEQGHGKLAVDRADEGALQAAGSYQRINGVDVVRIADERALGHEINGHVALESFATRREYEAVRKAFEPKAEAEGKGRAWDEVFADWMNERWQSGALKQPKTWLEKVGQRIANAIERLAYIIRPTVEGFAKRVESGEVYGRERAAGGIAGSAYSVAADERPHLEALWDKLVATYPKNTPAAKIASRFVNMVGNTDGDTALAKTIAQERIGGIGKIERKPEDARGREENVPDTAGQQKYGTRSWLDKLTPQQRQEALKASQEHEAAQGLDEPVIRSEADKEALSFVAKTGTESRRAGIKDGTPETPHKFSSTQVDLPGPLAERVLSAGKRIAESDLAGDGRETNPHITVKFGLHTEDASKVREVLAGEKPIRVKLGKLSTFPPSETSDGTAVIKADVDSPALHRLNAKIAEALPHTDTHPEYKPHVTLAYVKPEAASKYVGSKILAGQETTLDSIVFSSKSGEKTTIPLGEPKYATAPAEPPQMPEERKLRPIPPPSFRTEVTGEPATGSPPRVEANVENLRRSEADAGQPPADLARDTKQRWKTLEPEVRDILRNWTDEQFLARARDPKRLLSAPESQALDARTRGKEEMKDSAREAMLKATDPAKRAELQRSYAVAALDHTAFLQAYVGDGTAVARALAARAQIMKAAPGSWNTAFLRRALRELKGIDDKGAASMAIMFETGDPRLEDALRAYTASKWAKFNYVYRGNLISALTTITGINAGQFVNQGLHLADRASSAGADWALTKLTGQARERHLGEVGAGAMAALHTVPHAAKAALQDSLQGLRRIATAEPRKIDPTQPLAHQVSPLGGPVGRTYDALFGSHTALSKAWQDVSGAESLTALAYRKAVAEGKTGDALGMRTAEIVKDALAGDEEHTALLQEAQREAMARVYRDKPWDIVRGLNELKARHPWLNLVFPFTTIPANIARTLVRHTPVGFLPGGEAWNAIQDFRAGKISKGQAADIIAPRITGTLILGTAIAAAKSGLLTGGGPADKKAKAALLASGWQPYSFAFTGKDGKRSYIPFSRLEPLAQLLGTAADMSEMENLNKTGDLLDKTISTLKTNFLDRTYLEGLTTFVEALHDPQRYGSQWLTDTTASILVPNIVKKAAEAVDPVLRDVKPQTSGLLGVPEKTLKTIESRLPFLSEKLPARGTVEGTDAERQGNAFTRFVLPTQLSSDKPGAALEQEMGRLNWAPTTTFSTVTYQGKKYQTDATERQALEQANARAAGYAARLIKSPSYKALPDTESEGGGQSKEYKLRHLYERIIDEARTRVSRRAASRTRHEARA